MKLTVLQEQLKAGLSKVAHAVAGKSTLPVLSNVLLSTDGGRLKLAATNLEIGITCHIGAKVEEEGAVTLPAKLLADVVNSLPNERITLTLDEHTQAVEVECGRVEASIKGIEADEFPVIPTVDNGFILSITPDTARQVATRVAVAAASDDTRPVLGAVLMRVKGNFVTWAAADGFRLAVQRSGVPETGGKDGDYLIPARAIAQLARLAGANKDEGSITVCATPSNGQLVFGGADWQLVTRLAEGKFPDFERIIPSGYLTRTVVDTAEFTKSVKLASYFATHSAGIVKLDMQASTLTPGTLTISANAAEVGNNKSVIGDISIAGENGMIALKDTFLSEALAACGGAQVAMETASPQSPAVFKPVGDDTYLHVVMPVTLR